MKVMALSDAPLEKARAASALANAKFKFRVFRVRILDVPPLILGVVFASFFPGMGYFCRRG